MSEITLDVKAANLITEISRESSHAEHISLCPVCAESFATTVQLINDYKALLSCRSVLGELKRMGNTDPVLKKALLQAAKKIAETEGL